MTNFEKAFKYLFGIEGVYSNDKGDPGGETVFGLARNYDKSWAGWKLIDSKYKKNDRVDVHGINTDQQLKQLAMDYYKKEYWDIFDCDNVPYSLAQEIFEQCVNIGVSRCSRFLQTVLNALNYQHQFGSDIGIDGIWGRGSKARLKAVLAKHEAKEIQFGINCMQGNFYITEALKNQTKRKFIKGWIGQRTEAIYTA